MAEEFEAEACADSVELSVFVGEEEGYGKEAGGESVAALDVGVQVFHGEGADVDALHLDISPDEGQPRHGEQGRLVGEVGANVVL